jgi:hypothetical protein
MFPNKFHTRCSGLVHSVSEFLLVTTLITPQLHQDSIHRGNVALRNPTQRKKIDRPNWQHLGPIQVS